MEVTTILDINDICRVCLVPVIGQSGAFSLFTAENNAIQLWSKLMACALIQVFESDGLPRLICNKCHISLETSYNFKLQCESTDSHLRQILSLSSNISCVENAKKEYVHYISNTDFQKTETNDDNVTVINFNKGLVNKELNIEHEKTYNILNNHDNTHKSVNTNYNSFKRDLNEIVITIGNARKSDLRITNKSEVKEINKIYTNNCNDIEEFSKATLEENKICTIKNSEQPDKIQLKNKNTAVIQCELCGKLFKSQKHMTQHSKVHNRTQLYQCQICHHKFSVYNNLIIHSRIHSGDKPYICQVCGKGFTQSAGLTTHMRSHTGEKPFKCETCNKSFTQSSNLLIHKRIHSGKRDYVCKICHRAFKFSKHLQSHMKLHSGIKDYTCGICQKEFHRKSYLKIHMSIHTGNKPYKCTTCGHGFSNSSNLAAHVRIHTGVKPFICKICKKSFAQSSALNRHLQQHPAIK